MPYLPQLYDLPEKLLQSRSNTTELYDIYLATNPLVSALAFSLFLAPIFLVLSEINRNYSQVDRCWSILPTIYNAHYVAYAHLIGLNTRRLDTLLVLSTVWTIRLSFNYWRKGGYSIGSEDYRWKVIQSKIHPALFFVLNVVFISLIQSVLLCLMTAPTYVILLAGQFQGPVSVTDSVLSGVLMGLVFIEYLADQQQWNFQSAKAVYHKTAKRSKYDPEDLDRGFIVTGLWSWSRHPNFAAEQAIWFVWYIWSCVATDVLYNWAAVGAVTYMALFQGSTWLTESISAEKYPDYKEYQKRVGKFLPNLIRQLPGDFSDQKVKPPVEKKTRRVVSNAKGGR
ncbi:hypothetical protein DH86_00000665 [Scytalidium sp. 3C]|nr:hypothetical protein DH86_00000665 [Scytalidium sp. 3C]